MPRTERSAKMTMDHEEIRQWVESRGGHPATVKRTGGRGDPGILRIDFPGFSGQQSLTSISWDDFFEKFEEEKLAMLYQDVDDSRFVKLVQRPGTENERGRVRGRASRQTTSRAAKARPTRSTSASSRSRGSSKTSRSRSSATGRTRPSKSSRTSRGSGSSTRGRSRSKTSE